MQNLICPVCSLALKQNQDQRSLQCEHQHLFDIAKQGYVNLLLSQHKKSKHPGDTKEMVAARTRFLNQGHYQKIVDEFVLLATKYCTHTGTIAFADLGCGEGYYTERLHQTLLSSAKKSITTCGIDISTPAIKAACKRNKSIQWLVASASHIPIAPASQDLVSCLFFRYDAQEVTRIIKPNGFLISADTGQDHLIELRELLYDKVKTEKPDINLSKEKQLLHLETKHVTQKITLSSHLEIEQLLAMTPHFWRVKPEKKMALASHDNLTVTLDIKFNVFRRDITQ